MSKLITFILIIVGLIHLLPMAGALSAERLIALYGVSIQQQDNLEILLRHRAILLGLIGLLLIYAAFNPSFQTLAIIIAFLSTSSFILFTWMVDNPNLAIQKVAMVDWLASGLLLIALVVLQRSQQAK